MTLLTLRGVQLAFGEPRLLHDVDLDIDSGERVCVIGRNGAGKSTLLKLLAGDIAPDDGEVRRHDGVRVTRLGQDAPRGLAGNVFDVVSGGLGELGALLGEYHRLSQTLQRPGQARALEAVQSRIEAEHGWHLELRVERTISRLSLPPEREFSELSGGLKRRVLLGRALVCEPDVLLLDEPTNHLDIDAISWLEEFLAGFPGAVVFVTHDRRFLRRLATRIVEVDRGRVTSWPGDYDNYLRRRDERLHAETLARERFERKLAREEAWIRQGIKARRTRNEGRVRALEAMRRERAQRRELEGTVRMQAAAARASGKRVIVADGASFSWRGEPLISELSCAVMRGDRVGIIGPNGAGKTTLLKLLIGELQPCSGTISLGSNLEIAWFDQERLALDDALSAAENVAGGREFVDINGARRHIISYLQDFLFPPPRARAPITALSGGERNRLLLARLFATPSNLLVLDEPTNDLDVETLELLEELIANYAGTVLLVSHDRELLDNVITSSLVLEGAGRVREYVGGYEDWLRQRPPAAAPAAASERRTPRPAGRRRAAPGKLGYRESRELEALPARIEELERRIEALAERLGDPALYRDDGGDVSAANDELSRLQAELECAYGRWEALESARDAGR